jgi:fructose PTS system EIIBC or EIIC component
LPIVYLDMAVSVNLDLVAVDAADAIRQLAAALAGTPGVVDGARLVVDVLDRETVLSTYVGDGVALPHARTDAVTARVVAVARSAEGVPFGPKGERAHLIVLVGCPRQEVSAYLAFSRLLLRRLRMPKVRTELLTVREPARFLQLLELNEEAPAGSAAS